jgi:hypothetical protein
VAISTPALDELAERLQVNGVNDDPAFVASAILSLANMNEWDSQPEKMVTWLEQLALDVLHTPQHRAGEE